MTCLKVVAIYISGSRISFKHLQITMMILISTELSVFKYCSILEKIEVLLQNSSSVFSI